MTAHKSTTAACVSNSQSKSDAALECRLRKVIDAGPTAIAERLEELDSEWTAGRAVKATAGVLIVGGLALSLTLNLWWLVLPIVGGALLVQYLFGRTTLVGKMFHALGFRPGSEIDQEKLALRALRGDFAHLPTVHTIEDRDALNRMEGEGGPAMEMDDTKHDAEGAVKKLLVVVRT